MSVDVQRRKPDYSDFDEEYDVLEDVAEGMLRAIRAKDARGVAESLRLAFEICDSYSHDEGPHLEDSYFEGDDYVY